jgi:uncharacterized RDD family membrane protein YckC
VDEATMRTDYGPGTNAGFGSRLLAFFVDGALADLISFAIVRHYPLVGWHRFLPAIVFLAIEFLFVGFIGQTPGMRLLRVGVVKADHSGRAGFHWVALRTLLLAAVIPAIITDQTGRAMHDRAANTATIRTGRPTKRGS